MAKSYADAGYFTRNLRAMEVLIDQDAIRAGIASTEPWKFYDLGHGYCTYDFFEQCPHRMACANSSKAEINHSFSIDVLLCGAYAAKVV